MESTADHQLLKLLFLYFSTLCLFSSTPSANATIPEAALPTRSGYLTVNATTGSAIFYTFYEARQPTSPLSQTPLLIWLQGGPGCSSMIGNFYELGPWRVSAATEPISLEPNPGSWNRLFGLLFIDNPIGVGFSIAATTQEIPRNQYEVATHLFIAMTSFIALNPVFKSRPIFVTGESYAGKYVPAIGYYILRKNAQLPKSRQVNLAGVAVGNGLTDPATQVATIAAQNYFLGLVNEKQRKQLEELQREAIELTQEGNWGNASNARSKVLRVLQNMTGLATLYDFRRKTPYQDELVAKFLSNVEVKKALGANESIVFGTCDDLVGKVLHEDVMKSVKYMVEFLVEKSRVLLYQGQCDLRDGVVSTEAWVKKIRWAGIEKFWGAERKVWRVNGELAGYVQRWGSLSNVVVLGAGHLVPTDQAIHSQAMIEDWVLGRGLFADNNRGSRREL